RADRLCVRADLECQLTFEHVEPVDVLVVDVQVGSALAAGEARPRHVELRVLEQNSNLTAGGSAGDWRSAIWVELHGSDAISSLLASRAAASTTSTNARSRSAPSAPPGSRSWKRSTPPTIGSAFVRSVAAPAAASAPPR